MTQGCNIQDNLRAHGNACKAIFDCTVPFDQKARFERAKFLDIDPAKWAEVLQ